MLLRAKGERSGVYGEKFRSKENKGLVIGVVCPMNPFGLSFLNHLCIIALPWEITRHKLDSHFLASSAQLSTAVEEQHLIFPNLSKASRKYQSTPSSKASGRIGAPTLRHKVLA